MQKGIAQKFECYKSHECPDLRNAVSKKTLLAVKKAFQKEFDEMQVEERMLLKTK